MFIVRSRCKVTAEEDSRLEQDLACDVVICEFFRLAVAL
jgi:hypothetical protein